MYHDGYISVHCGDPDAVECAATVCCVQGWTCSYEVLFAGTLLLPVNLARGSGEAL